MSKDVDVSVAGTQFEIGITLTVPAIQKFFHVIVVITQGEAIRIVQVVPSPIALHLHCFTVTSPVFHAPSRYWGSHPSRYHFEQTDRTRMIAAGNDGHEPSKDDHPGRVSAHRSSRARPSSGQLRDTGLRIGNRCPGPHNGRTAQQLHDLGIKGQSWKCAANGRSVARNGRDYPWMDILVRDGILHFLERSARPRVDVGRRPHPAARSSSAIVALARWRERVIRVRVPKTGVFARHLVARDPAHHRQADWRVVSVLQSYAGPLVSWTGRE